MPSRGISKVNKSSSSAMLNELLSTATELIVDRSYEIKTVMCIKNTSVLMFEEV